MHQAWRSFLGSPGSGHGVQIYAHVDEVADSVAAYLAAGWERDEPALVLATPEHREVVEERLQGFGWEAPALADEGLLVYADAESTLRSISPGGTVSPRAFDDAVGGLIGQATEHSGKPARVFSELADLLRRREQLREALAVEALWRSAAERRDFSLLCGFCVDVFDRAAQTQTLPQVCAQHSHVLPARKYARFARCVDEALDEVLGSREAGRLYMLLGREIQEERIPAAQLILMWVSSNMPILADRILESARTHYLAKTA